MTDVTSKVTSIIADHLGVEKEQINETSNYITDLGADSLDTVELIMNFEEAFGIKIPDDSAEKIQTVGDTIRFIEAALAGKDQ